MTLMVLSQAQCQSVLMTYLRVGTDDIVSRFSICKTASMNSGYHHHLCSVGTEEWSGLNVLAEITLSFYITTPDSVTVNLQPVKNQLTPGAPAGLMM